MSFCYTSRAGFFFFFVFVFFLIWGVSLTHPMLDLFVCGCFTYTSIADFVFMWGVSLTHPVLPSFLSWEILFVPFYFIFIFIFLSGEFLLHIPYWFNFFMGEILLHLPCWVHFYRGCFSYTSRAGFFFVWGVSLTHPMLAFLFFLFFIFIDLGSFSYTSRTG